MATTTHELKGLRNTRDLRAAILELAADALTRPGTVRLDVRESELSAQRVRAEWDRLLPALDPALRARMQLRVSREPARTKTLTLVGVGRPNYVYEVLRLLLGARLAGTSTPMELTQVGITQALGASLTPVRAALTTLRDAGLIESLRKPVVEPTELSTDVLSRIGALPTPMKFRFERGAVVKPPVALLKRARLLLGRKSGSTWGPFALSGTAVALQEVRGLDLIGTPRLDFVAYVGIKETMFDVSQVRALDDALELETRLVAPAPVTVTLVRAQQGGGRRVAGVHSAEPADVLLALHELGLRDAAIGYTKALRL